MTSTTENYLKAIYSLRRGGSASGEVSLGGIAERLGVTPGTVTTMMRHLEDKGLVEYRPRQWVRLTPAGWTEATGVIRRHRIIELFLVEVMGLDWAEVHVEAEELEHSVSDRLLARMDEMLGYPTHDPHGDPIPNADGILPLENSEPIAGLTGGRWRLVRILGDEAEFLHWLRQVGLQPGTQFEVEARDTFAGTVTLRFDPGQRRQTLSLTAAARLLATVAESP